MANLLGRPDKPPITPALENHQKMLKIKALSAAIDRAKAMDPGVNKGLTIQRLMDQRQTIKATLPPLRLVHSAPPLTFKVTAA